MTAQAEPPKDAKTTLQEWVQARGLGLQRMIVAGAFSGTGTAGSKRAAEQLAAEALLNGVGLGGVGLSGAGSSGTTP